MSSRLRRLIIGLVILLACVGCDQVTKTLATRQLCNSPPLLFLGGTVRLQYALNSGGFLGLGSTLPKTTRQWLFVGLNTALLGAICCLLVLRPNMSLGLYISLFLVLAGGIGAALLMGRKESAKAG